jgi:mlo protein
MFELWSIKITICSFSELMLMGFISLLLTVFQDPISNICISKEIGESWLPCSHSETKKKTKETKDRKLMEYFDPTPRRILATKGIDKCVAKVQLKPYNFELKLHL